MERKRVLLLTFAYGSGHYIAGLGILQAIEELKLPWEVLHIDGILESHRRIDRLTADMYLWFSRKGHRYWKIIYENPLTRSRVMKYIMRLSLNRELLKRIMEFHPHAIVSTHFLSHQYAFLLKRKGLRFKHYMVITDYEVHPIWISEPTDTYFLPSEWSLSTVKHLNKFEITGIPLRKPFWNPPSREEGRRHLKIQTQKPILFMNLGTYGVMPLSDALNFIERWKGNFYFLIVAGRNEQNFRAFEGMLQRREFEGQVFSFTQDIPYLMAASNLVITKAGGLTVAEMLAVGRAGIYYRSMPGQEKGNERFILENGAGFSADNLPQLNELLEKLIANWGEIERVEKNAKKLGKPKSSLEIVKHVSHETG